MLERVRLEFGHRIEFMALHPRLCEEDGERLMGRVLHRETTSVTVACAEKRQEKLLRDGYGRAGVAMDERHRKPVSMAMESTGSVFDSISTLFDAECLC